MCKIKKKKPKLSNNDRLKIKWSAIHSEGQEWGHSAEHFWLPHFWRYLKSKEMLQNSALEVTGELVLAGIKQLQEHSEVHSVWSSRQ